MYGRSPAPKRSYGGRSAEERRAERRERLLSAGLELFGTQGYAATSIERLCSAAAVSTRNFYEEFTGREALLTALHDDLNTRAITALSEACAATADAHLATRVEQGVRAYLAVTAADPRWARINYVEIIGVSAEVERHRMAWRERWSKVVRSLVADAVTRGEAADRDYDLTAVALIGATDHLVQHWVHHWPDGGPDGPKISGDDIVTELTRIFLATVTPA